MIPANRRPPRPKLVPLSPQQSGNYGAGMLLIGPVSRSAGQPAATQGISADDQWFPRGSRPPLQSPHSPLRPAAGSAAESTNADAPTGTPMTGTPMEAKSVQANTATSTIALDAPANDTRVADTATDELVQADTAAIGDDAQPALNVTDPEQNEPTDPLPGDAAETDALQPHLDDAGLDDSAELEPSESDGEGDAGTVASDEMALEAAGDIPETSQNDPLQRLEIRRLQLKNPGSAGSITARPAGSRSGTRMSVGDVPLGDEQVRSDELGVERIPEETPHRIAVTDQPIHGDRITAAGELILASGKSAANLPVLPQTAPLKPTIEAALRYYWDRPEDAAERTHWGMMHSIMVWDKDTPIIHRRQRYNAVAWMAGNNPCRNQLLFAQDQHGINVRTGVGLQGHQAQLLAIFGLVNVPLNYPVYAGRQKYSVADILEREKLDCKSGNELTFTLIALAHYADSDSSWVAADQQDWDVQRVLKEEMSQPIVGAACGGTHRLMGFAHALRRRRAEDKPIVQQWDRADRYVKEFVNYTWTLQNRDGSMSTAWFERPEDNGNMDRKIQTTGHMLEFLLSTLPDADLQSPKMIRTVSYLANTLHAERGHQWQVGPKGHALRALAMYHQRVFGDATPWRSASESRRTAGASPGRGVR